MESWVGVAVFPRNFGYGRPFNNGLTNETSEIEASIIT